MTKFKTEFIINVCEEVSHIKLTTKFLFLGGLKVKKIFALFLLCALSLGAAVAQDFKTAGEFKCTGNPEQWLSPSEVKAMVGKASTLTLKATVTAATKEWAWFQTLTDFKKGGAWNGIVKIIDESSTTVGKVYTATISSTSATPLSAYLEKGILLAGTNGMKVKLEYAVK